MYTNMYAGDYTWVQTLLMHMLLPFAHKQTFTGFFHRVFCNWPSETCQGCHTHTFPNAFAYIYVEMDRRDSY